jgi:hypothetical protein
MKERVNDETNLVRRNWSQHRRVCNSHFGCGWLCWLTANNYSKPGGAANALRPDQVGPDSDRQYLEEKGSVTAEFAIVLPAVIIVLGVALSVLAIQTSRIGLVGLAAESSRALARGESEALIQQLLQGVGLEDSVTSKTSYLDQSICVELAQINHIKGLGELFPIEVKEIQCARKGGL